MSSRGRGQGASRPRRRAAEAADAALLARRLHELGLRGVSGVEVHTNRRVLVSVTARGVLRLHRGYAYAPDRVLRAVVRFLNPLASRRARKAAEGELVAFPVDAYVASTPPARNARGKVPRLVRRLAALHAALNRRHFGGRLGRVRFRVSARMATRLGEITVDRPTGRPLEIAIGLRHIERDGWAEVRETLLHEMIHQWQAESGLPVDHGPAFRRKARELEISPRARRDVLPEQPELLET